MGEREISPGTSAYVVNWQLFGQGESETNLQPLQPAALGKSQTQLTLEGARRPPGPQTHLQPVTELLLGS